MSFVPHPGPPDIPACAWTRRLDETTVPKRGRPVGPTLKLLLDMFPGVVRAVFHLLAQKRLGRRSVLYGNSWKAKPNMGVPLGGIGGGTVTRGWRGDFVRWQMRPGLYHYGVVPADAFSLWARREDGRAPDGGPAGPGQALVLGPRPEAGTAASAKADRSRANALAAWKWDLDPRKATYHALFPRAWTVYDEPVPGVRLTCRQVSPVIPHNYRESSFPVGVFVWTVENTGTDAADVALMFSFQNGTGEAGDLAGGHVNRAFEEPLASEPSPSPGARPAVIGVELRHKLRWRRPLDPGQRRDTARTVYEDPLAFAIAARADGGVEVTRRTRFTAGGSSQDRSVATDAAAPDAATLWQDFATDGRLNDGPGAAPPGVASAASSPSLPGEAIGAAVAARVRVPAGESRELVFALAWDMPVARFESGAAWYRRHTMFYGQAGGAAPALARDALFAYPDWEAAIEAWQKPVLADPGLPDWYKGALFNETYYITDGGTIWTAGKAPSPQGAGVAPPASADLLPEPAIGHFAYLEAHEYLMYNTYDVHFTASFALARLWPELELSLQRDFARALLAEHPETVRFLISGQRGPRKTRGVVPHDLGDPGDEPWVRLNAYNAQDISRWKDLNPKFVLQLWRDYALTRDRAFLAEVWPAAEEAMDYMLRFDRDGDGLIENEGFPDQTYDVWSALGPSAYSGGLWLGALAAAAAMAGELGHTDRQAAYQALLARAQSAYESRLWNGVSYDYDASGSPHHDSVMADQLCGPWFAAASGLAPVVSDEHARSALRRVFDLNVMGRAGLAPGDLPGERGAVNGMRPDGGLDRTCMQSAEVWLGTTYSLAADMLRHGMTEEAFTTARGAYLSVWRDYGLWFQTPEAIDVDGVYRALGYMRPLAIWAMQWEWEKRRSRRHAVV